MKTRRFFAIVLTICLLFTGIPLTNTQAAESLKVGDNATATISSDGTVVYSGTGALYDYEYNESPWYNNTTVKKVVIGNGITSIGNCTFSGCSNLSSISLPNSLTEIGTHVFYNNTSLCSIVIPEGVTQLSNNVFFGCSKLESVSLPQSLNILGSGVFWKCYSLLDISFPSNLTTIGNCTFYGCNGLTSITIPESVTTIEVEAFKSCSNLNSVTISGDSTSLHYGCFSECSPTLIIYGKQGSNAETYATDNSIRFQSLDGESNNKDDENNTKTDGEYSLIYNESDFLKISDNLSGKYKLANDITLYSTDNSTYIDTFKGTLEGNGYTISVPGTALFKSIEKGATVKNFKLKLTRSSISTVDDVFGTVAIYNSGTIEDIETSGNVSRETSGWIGGIVGRTYDGTIKHCKNEINYYITNSSATLYNNVLGGIAAQMNYDARILQCWNSGNMTLTVQDGPHSSPQGNSNGGIVGMGGYSSNQLEECANSGLISTRYNNLMYSYKVYSNVGFISGDEYSVSNMSSNSEKHGSVDSSSFVCNDSSLSLSIISEFHTSTSRSLSANDTSYTRKSLSGIQAWWDSLNSGSEDTANDSNNSEETIVSITKIAGSKKNYYGANYYDNTAVGDVYDDAKEFVKAMDYYLSELQKATQKDAKTAKNTKKSSAEILRERDASSDSKIITMESTLPDEALDSVYETLAQYLDMYVEEGKTLGKIDMSASTIEISAGIINKIRNNIDWSQFQRTIGKYNVSFNVINFLGAYMGKVTVVRGNKTYYGVIVSSSKDTAKVLTEYINTMSEWEKDALYQALKSVFSELSSVTGISDFTASKIKSLFKDKVELLRNHGYGDLLKYCNKIRDGYDIVNTIVSAKDADSLTDAMKNAESVYKKIKNLDYLDATVTNNTIKLAMNRLTNAKNQLEKDLFDYVYSGNTNNENWITKKWNSFKSLFVQCPVDVIIYDVDGNTLGQIIDTDYSYSEDIYIEVDDDVKTIIIPNDLDVKIKFIGSDVGEMTYVIEQTENGKVVGRANYYNIPLNDGKQFLQKLDDGSISEDFQGSVQSDNESINPSEYLSANNKNANVSIQCEATEGGTIIGTGVYPKGEPVVLNAYPDDGYCFKGWYIDDQLQNISSVYRFAASQNANLKAKFKKIRERESIYGVEISDEYKDTTDFIVYKNGDSTNDISICMAGNANIDNLSVKLKPIGNNITQTENSTIFTVYDGVSRFWINSVDIQNMDALEIYEAESNVLIGTIYYSNILDIAHRYGDWTTTKTATCTEKGEEQRICSTCGKKETREISALGHKYSSEWTTDKVAICTESGSKSHHCTVCGDKKDVTTIPTLGHKYSDWTTTTKTATCTEKGEEQRTCSTCGKKETREISALGHKYSSQWTIDKVATCTKSGSKSHHCTVCGDKKDVTTIPALGHKYSDWITTKTATCTEKGEEQRTCSCGEKENREIPTLGHAYSTKWTIDKATTCKATGSKSHHCTRCGAKKDVTTIPKTVHKYSSWKTIKNATSKTNGKQQRKCSVCGKTETREIFSLAITQISVSNKTYTGKQIIPAVTVKYGKTNLKANTDYTITYGTNKATGKGTVTITGKGKYVGKVTKTFKILPRKTTVSLKSSSRGKITVSYTKKSEAVKYKIQYADNSKFNKATTKTVSAKTTKITVSGKPGKYYYVRVSVIGKDGTDSGWSTVKKIKVK